MSPLVIEILGWLLLVTATVLSLIGLPGPLLAVLVLVVWWTLEFPIWLGLMELSLLGILLLTGEAAEHLGGFVGMKWSGIHSSGWRGALFGGFVGLLVSIFLLNPLFIIVGILLGAWVGELIAGEPMLDALKIAIGFGLGKFGGYVVKNLIMISVLIYLVVLKIWFIV